jgi:uncharacterized membrane protein HdeD (DUF308 family)
VNELMFYAGISLIALACILGTIAHTFHAPARKPKDDGAWLAGTVGVILIIAAIVEIWL